MDELLVFCASIGGLLLFDGLAWRGKLGTRDKIVYGAILAISMYAGIDFAFHLDWPDYLDLANIPFGKAANAVDQALGVDWSQ